MKNLDHLIEKKVLKAAESREKALDKMERIDAPDKEKEASKIKFETQVKSGYDVLHIENLAKAMEINIIYKSFI